MQMASAKRRLPHITPTSELPFPAGSWAGWQRVGVMCSPPFSTRHTNGQPGCKCTQPAMQLVARHIVGTARCSRPPTCCSRSFSRCCRRRLFSFSRPLSLCRRLPSLLPLLPRRRLLLRSAELPSSLRRRFLLRCRPRVCASSPAASSVLLPSSSLSSSLLEGSSISATACSCWPAGTQCEAATPAERRRAAEQQPRARSGWKRGSCAAPRTCHTWPAGSLNLRAHPAGCAAPPAPAVAVRRTRRRRSWKIHRAAGRRRHWRRCRQEPHRRRPFRRAGTLSRRLNFR